MSDLEKIRLLRNESISDFNKKAEINYKPILKKNEMKFIKRKKK